MTGLGGEVVAVAGVNDLAGGVDQEAAVAVHAVFGNIGQTAALGAYTGYQEEVIGHHFTYFSEHFGACGTYHIHHIFFVAPGRGVFEYALKEAFAVLVHVLEVVGALVGGERQQNNPDRKSTRLNSSHVRISYAVFCLKKKSK